MEQLQARLQEAETRLLREKYRWTPVIEKTFIDDRGFMLVPRGQPITIRTVQEAGEISIIHTCIVATPAEIDYVLRACRFYAAHTSAMAVIIPVVVTLSIGTFSKTKLSCKLLITTRNLMYGGQHQANRKRQRKMEFSYAH